VGFPPSLLPAFASILEEYYAFEYKEADERCREFGLKLAQERSALGPSWECTARCFCIVQSMVRYAMGYRNYPSDLPFSKPYLDPLPELNEAITDEYIVHRVVSAAFLYWELACVTGGLPDWTADRMLNLVDSIGTFIVRVMPRFPLDNQDGRPISDLTVGYKL
jgi:hypothetical protein